MPLPPPHHGPQMKCRVDTFSATAGKKNLFRLSSNQGGDLSPCLLKGLFDRTGKPISARGVAPVRLQEWDHDLDYFRVYPRCRIVVKVSHPMGI